MGLCLLPKRAAQCTAISIIVVLLAATLVSADEAEDKRIAEINKRNAALGYNWTAGRTSVSGLSVEEKKHLLGLLPLPAGWKNERAPMTAPAGISFESEYDWRDHNGVSPVRNQGQCGSCWAFAAVAQLESHTLIYDQRLDDLSEQQSIDCDLLEGDCNGGPVEAAYEVFSWDEVSLNIQNSCQQKTKRIKRDLQAILLEAMRLKDERRQQDETVRPGQKKEESGLEFMETQEGPSAIEQLMDVINKAFEQGSGVEDIYYDDSWEGLVSGINTLGAVFEGGALRAGYVDRGESQDFILVPREKVIVISVNPRCPRDRIMEVLGAQER